MAEWWLAISGRLKIGDVRQLERQTLFRNGVWHPVLVINGERLTPIALTAKDGITQSVVDGLEAYAHFGDSLYHSGHSFFYFHACDEVAVDADAYFTIKALTPCGWVADLIGRRGDNLTNGEIEMTCKSEIAAVVCWHSHDGSCSITSQHIVANIDRYAFVGEWIDGIGTREHSAHLFSLCLALTL